MTYSARTLRYMDDRIADAPRVDASARRRVGTSARGGGGMASPWRAEARAHVALALPVTLASLCNRARDLISLGFVGAASATDGLAGAALASTIANVTGNAVVVGLTSALLTLAGQAYGDGRGGEAWAWAQRALACCAATATATAIGWRFVEDALLAWNFDAAIARSCAAYLRGLRPGLFAYAANACAQAWLQAQGCARPIAFAGRRGDGFARADVRVLSKDGVRCGRTGVRDEREHEFGVRGERDVRAVEKKSERMVSRTRRGFGGAQRRVRVEGVF